jgi:GNAT superfamily N-acetyltransferase
MPPADDPTSGTNDLTMTLGDVVDEAARAGLAAGLERDQPAQIPPFSPRPLVILLHDAEGRLVGGLLGRSFWGWIVIELLWIDAVHRGTGHGRRLVSAAEGEGRLRGCHHVRVDTYSFQAPGFYEKCGYARVASLPDFPLGHQRHFYAKALT